MIRALAVLACLLTVCITGASAFIRHSQAGLGCADRAECRQAVEAPGTGAVVPGVRSDDVAGVPTGAAAGVVADAATHSARAGKSRAVFIARALHRVSASLVGLLSVGLLVFGWNGLSRSGRTAVVLALLLSVFLAWLGRYTPHAVPWITIGNVAGGFALAACFAWSAVQASAAAVQRRPPGAGVASGFADSGFTSRSRSRSWIGVASIGWILLAALIWLGLMIGARDAIPACPEPLCLEGARLEAAAFDPGRAQPSASAAGGQALHLAHRLVAVGFVLLAAALISRLVRAGRPRLAVLAAAMLVAQLVLGLSTAAGIQPLASATMHNVVAALWGVLLAGLAAGSYRSELPPLAASSAAADSMPSSRARSE